MQKSFDSNICLKNIKVKNSWEERIKKVNLQCRVKTLCKKVIVVAANEGSDNGPAFSLNIHLFLYVFFVFLNIKYYLYHYFFVFTCFTTTLSTGFEQRLFWGLGISNNAYLNKIMVYISITSEYLEISYVFLDWYS